LEWNFLEMSMSVIYKIAILVIIALIIKPFIKVYLGEKTNQNKKLLDNMKKIKK